MTEDRFVQQRMPADCAVAALGDVFDRRVMDWSESAILSVPSLNEAEGVTHSVYWDGRRAWDPQQGREGKLTYTNQMAREVAITGIQRRTT
jgi:hypothetical protein